MGGELALIGTAIAVGLGAAFLPVFVNAEVYVVAIGATVDSRLLLVILIVVHVIATTVGKAIVFQLARKGTRKIRSVDRRPPRNRFVAWIRRVGDRLLGLLDRPYAGGLTAFASSLTGVPPLAIVTLLAGASKQPQWLFLDHGVRGPADPVPRHRLPVPPAQLVLTPGHVPSECNERRNERRGGDEGAARPTMIGCSSTAATMLPSTRGS